MDHLETIYICLCLLILFIMGISDIKRKSIDVRFMVPASVLLAAGGMALCSASPTDRLLGLIPGIMMLVINRVSKESVGMADVAAIASIGVGMGFFRSSGAIMCAFFLCGIFALAYAVIHHKTGRMRKQSIPFIPFVFLGVIVNEILKM